MFYKKMIFVALLLLLATQCLNRKILCSEVNLKLKKSSNYSAPIKKDIVGDDALQNVFSQEEVNLDPQKCYYVTKTIVCNNSVRVNGNGATIFLKNDIDYLLFSEGKKIEIDNLNFIKADNGFYKLNRAIRCNNVDFVKITSCNFSNFGTAIHNNEGKILECNDIRIYNAIGTKPHYGYGINTSAQVNIISNIIGYGNSETNGRHLIYLNGKNILSADIKKVHCHNWHFNPIEIHTYNEIGAEIEIRDVSFSNVNLSYMDKDRIAGCINVTKDNTGRVYIHNMSTNNIDTTLFSTVSNSTFCNLENITVNNSGKRLFYFKNGNNHKLKNITVRSSKDINNFEIMFINTKNCLVENIDVFNGKYTPVLLNSNIL